MPNFAVIKRHDDFYIVGKEGFPTETEANLFGIFWGLRLASLDYVPVNNIVRGEFPEKYFSLTEETEAGLVELFLVEGPTFDSGLLGKDTAEFKFTPPDRDLFIVGVFMDEKFQFNIAVSLDPETKAPLVLLGDGTGYLEIKPDQARQLGVDLLHAAEASESDSLIARVLAEVYTEEEMSAAKKQAFIDALRRFREEDRYNALEETESEEIDSEEVTSS